jgi:hypothetical protein
MIIDEPQATLPDAERDTSITVWIIDLEMSGISTGRLEAASCNARRYRGSCGE